MAQTTTQSTVYKGQFGDFTIDQSDRLEVIIYRSGLIIAAIGFAVGTYLGVTQNQNLEILSWITICFWLFSVGLGISLLTIHIYLIPLHRLLQICWGIGTISGVILAVKYPQPLFLFIYENPLAILGIGFTFAALTGIYFKEAFCFRRWETRILTPIVPFLLIGHLLNLMPLPIARIFLSVWAFLFLIFAIKKIWQPIPSDIGDKSVFIYLKQQKATN